MRRSWTPLACLALLSCLIAAAAALAAGSQAAPTAQSASAASRVYGTVETSMVINRFTTAGTRVVGHATATSTQRDAAGRLTATKTEAVNLTLRQTQATPGPCQVLFLELDELDLQLLGLRVHLRSATAGEPVRLTLSADSTHGVLGKLFCDLSQAAISTQTKAKTAAKTLNRSMTNTQVFHATATIYAPAKAAAKSTSSSSRTTQSA